jgi:hypothetical protein
MIYVRINTFHGLLWVVLVRYGVVGLLQFSVGVISAMLVNFRMMGVT